MKRRSNAAFFLATVSLVRPITPTRTGQLPGVLDPHVAEAEAKRQGFDSIYLMTNDKMTENQDLYARIGYVLFDRQIVHGYSRVLMRKRLT